MPRSLIAVANEQVSFLKALEWAGTSVGRRDRGVKVACPLCGSSGGMRVYYDHGYCYSERLWVSPVRLLAEIWDLEWADAADRALEMIGYIPPDYASRWAELTASELPPARDELADALRIWCSASCPDWQSRQFDPGTARALASCISVLPSVRSGSDCDEWLARCKKVMGKIISGPYPTPLNLG